MEFQATTAGQTKPRGVWGIKLSAPNDSPAYRLCHFRTAIVLSSRYICKFYVAAYTFAPRTFVSLIPRISTYSLVIVRSSNNESVTAPATHLRQSLSWPPLSAVQAWPSHPPIVPLPLSAILYPSFVDPFTS